MTWWRRPGASRSASEGGSDAAPQPLRDLVAATGSTLVLHDAACAPVAAGLAGPGVVVRAIGTDLQAAPQRWSSALLLVADPVSLRQVVSVLPRVGRSRTVGIWVRQAAHVWPLTPRPEWPATRQLQVRALHSGLLAVLRTERAVPISAVLTQYGRQAGRTDTAGAVPVLASTVSDPGVAPPMSPGMPVLTSPEAANDADLVVPPDIVLADAVPADVVLVAHPGRGTSAHPVTGRPVLTVRSPADLVGPVDEGVINPVGFRADPGQGIAELSFPDASAAADPTVRTGSSHHGLDHGVTADLVEALRDHQGVRVTGVASPASALAVATLACAGVPVLATPTEGLGPGLRAVVSATADLSSPLAREEYSIRLRRAALAEHGTRGWRRGLARAAGLNPAQVSVSILLATKRPEQVDFALRQVARQRGVEELELVVITHGFEVDADSIQARSGRPTVVVPVPGSTPFGSALNLGLRAASGDLVTKMDDDDWYSPDHVADLVLARQYSGADVVGTTFEFVYVHESDQTIHRRDASELFTGFVAGGSLLLERTGLRELGGFRDAHKYVDAALLSQVRAAGGTVYRTHGLGYVLRRQPAGHTWVAGTDYFVDPAKVRETRPGFAPSALLEADAADLPSASPTAPLG